MKPINCNLLHTLGVSLITIMSGNLMAAQLDKSITLPAQSKVGVVSPKIVGGNPSTMGENRWITSLQFNQSHFCGGALIADNWVMTAAHCVIGESADGTDFTVWIGGHDLRNEAQGIRIDVAEIIQHEQYNDGTLANDIALLRLAEAAPQEIPRVVLATDDVMSNAAAPNQPVTVSGWGALSSGGASPDQLHEVVVPIASGQTCNSPEAYNGEITANQICAGLRQGGKDSCQGDSGGPLWLNYEGQDYHVGIVSFGEGCALPNKYGVYTRTRSYTNWVSTKLGSDGGQPPGQCPDPGGDGNPGNGNDMQLNNGQTVSGISGAIDSQIQYTIDIPEGASFLSIETFGGSGDVDLYVAYNRPASATDADYAPYLNGNDERVDVAQPEAGTWHITLVGYDNYDNVSLLAQFNN